IDHQRALGYGLDAVVVVIPAAAIATVAAIAPTGTISNTAPPTTGSDVTLDFVLLLDVEVDHQVGFLSGNGWHIAARLHFATDGAFQGLRGQGFVTILVGSGLPHEREGPIARQVGIRRHLGADL